ncbi:HTTM domain-containing protein [Jatrophihabitans sp.]|uniref:HTTM domain-containing protein n=1 Tax=Jatrophihabitans sp. TaxID=1932789 RepID=UPI0030C71183|nr:hypothetical protein [Jatrophihabitans sp.]
MDKFWARFDSWVQAGPFRSQDLAIYRIIYALLALATMPTFSPLTRYPSSLYKPPPGPFELFDGFPSKPVLIAMELLLAVALSSLLMGFFTRVSSLATSILYMVGYGFNYSLGKIDHTILLAVAPAVLAFSGWGSRYSVDSLLGRARQRPEPQWQMRVLGMCIGVAFATAATQKLVSGWLSLSSQAVLGQFYTKYLTEDKHSVLASVASHVHAAAPWELLDWVTVILEFSSIVAILWWRAFRGVLANLALFHVGVLLVLNIKFATDVIVYGSFVTWAPALARLPGVTLSPQRTEHRVNPALVYPGAVAAILAIAAGFWSIARYAPTFGQQTELVIILAGGVGAVCYGVTQFSALRERPRRARPAHAA